MSKRVSKNEGRGGGASRGTSAGADVHDIKQEKGKKEEVIVLLVENISKYGGRRYRNTQINQRKHSFL